MRWFLGLAVAAILLVSCGSGPTYADSTNTVPSTTQAEPSSDVQTYNLPDGRTVVCIVTGWGISCDWNGAG